MNIQDDAALPINDKKSKEPELDVQDPVKDKDKLGPNVDPKDPVKKPKKPGSNVDLIKDPVKDPKKPGPNVDPKDGLNTEPGIGSNVGEPFKIFLWKDVPEIDASGIYATARLNVFKRLVDAGNVSGAVDYDLTPEDVQEMCRLITELLREKILTRKNTMDLFFEISKDDLIYYIEDDDDEDMKNG